MKRAIKIYSSATYKITFIYLFIFFTNCQILLNAQNTIPSTQKKLFYAEENLWIEHITVADGLPENSVRDILQDRFGFIWLTTQNGLVKYDGYNYKVYQNDPDNPESLSSNFTIDVLEDHLGVIWVGTQLGGLNKYNRAEDNFTRYLPDPDNPGSLNGPSALTIYEDKNNILWVGANGLNKFDRQGNTFICYTHEPNDTNSISHNSVYSIIEDHLGNFWVGTRDGLNILDRATEKFTRINSDPSDTSTLSGNRISSMLQDNQNRLWFGTSYNGVNQYDYSSGSFKRYPLKKSDNPSLNANRVFSIMQDKSGSIILGTYGGGIFILDEQQNNFVNYFPLATDYRVLNSNIILSLFEDRTGVLWIGTFTSGLNKVDKYRNKFKCIRQSSNLFQGLSNRNVLSLIEDKYGQIWIGTGGGGINILNRKNWSLTNINTNSKVFPLSNDIVLDLFMDSSGDFWAATARGLNKINHTTKRITKYFHNKFDSKSLSSNNITAIAEDPDGDLWITTRGGGLNKFNKSTGEAKHYFADNSNPEALYTNILWSVFFDSNGTLWIGADIGGLHRYNPDTDSFTRFHDYSIGLNTVLSIFEDSKNRLWLGDYNGGLLLFDRATETAIQFNEKDGLPHNTILGIAEDKYGHLWIGTDKGLSKFDYESRTFTNYDGSDGLQGMSFSHNAAIESKDGTMFFGGEDGLNYFQPEELAKDTTAPQIVLTNFRLFNEDVEIAPNSPLNENINSIKEINLSYWENDISIEYAALHFSTPERNTYAYILENYDDAWRYVSTQRKATYTNLDPGVYIFKVKGANKDLEWSKTEAELTIVISSPPWKTWWAYSLYIVVLISLFGLLRRYDTKRMKLKHNLELKNAEAEKLYEMDQMKTRFFANISHEFRTPLTLILGPIEKLLAGNFKGDVKKQYGMIRRNAQRLHRLINQLLDLSKIEAGKMKFSATLSDIVKFTKPIVQSFNSLAERKQIDFDYDFPKDKIFLYFDHDKLEKIVYNLVSNAFKFTNKTGSVYFSIGINETANSASPSKHKLKVNKFVEIIVKDGGIGIPEKDIDKIFDRFYQADDSQIRESEGTGIGLALTKELVELHHGDIFVTSEVNVGSTFIVRLPIDLNGEITGNPSDITDRKLIEPELYDESSPEIKKLDPASMKLKSTDKHPLILIVEDNNDLREYIRENLETDYQTIEASNGAEGIEYAVGFIPDLIISDVMMPKIDGIKLCNKIKTDERTCHIPVILLTAKASGDTKIKGLETGADDYITKPFNAKELLVRVKNLITQRRKLRERYKKEITLEPKKIAITSTDDKFLQKVINYIEENISDNTISVESMGKEIGLSRVQLYRKLHALTDQSASEFIRTFRLKRAAQLLSKNNGTISEISFEVGFNEPSYFTKCFKAQYGMSPSEFIAENSKAKK